MASNQPLTVVAHPEGEQRWAEGLDGGEVLHPEELFFRSADEALGAAVARGFPHERWAAREPKEVGLERITHA
jgi:hypothetical protein